ncbi:MAG: hypothetical protein QOI62_3639 [Solirubrobacteraceae bacterium]|jgi:hypothetical protein|nr:hypothetical protein [Solirubrobacteraceae bacterium]MEA2360379.1 hypothetical protein [Solirubrobacteraceae bacterium]MEA2392134.1 hypothetical protein [Solirubrobacteraceae bacterium]
MGYRIMGRAHGAALWARSRMTAADGQGTVEYVALILLVAGLMAGVIAAGKGLKGDGIASAIVGKIKQTIEDVGGK